MKKDENGISYQIEEAKLETENPERNEMMEEEVLDALMS